jgi:hypothetical protein
VRGRCGGGLPPPPGRTRNPGSGPLPAPSGPVPGEPRSIIREHRYSTSVVRIPTSFLALILAPLLAAQEVQEVPPLKAGVTGAPPRGPGGIIAIVNDDVITQAELEKSVERRRVDLARRLPASVVDREFLRLVYIQLEALIDDKLILQLIKKEEEKEKRPYVTEAEVDASILEEVERQKPNGITSPEDFYRIARERDGDTREELRTMIRNRLAVNNYLWRNVFVMSNVVSPQESRQYYREHWKDFSTPEKISFIQLPIRITRDRRAEVIVKAVEDDIAAKIPFGEIVKKYAADAEDDPNFAARVKTKTFEELQHWKEPIPKVLRALKKSQISERVVTQDTVHFFECVEIHQGRPKPYSEVQEEIAKKIREKRNSELLDEFLGRIRKKARIEVFLPPFPEAVRARQGDKAGTRREAAAAAAAAKQEKEAPGSSLPSAPAGSSEKKETQPAPPRSGE